MKVWLMVGDTYESDTSHAVFKDKPQRHQVVRFIIDHYLKTDGYAEEVILSDDYTIRCYTHDMKTGWSPKPRNFDQFVDDVLSCNGDGNDGDDYGTYFCMTEMDLIE